MVFWNHSILRPRFILSVHSHPPQQQPRFLCSTQRTLSRTCSSWLTNLLRKSCRSSRDGKLYLCFPCPLFVFYWHLVRKLYLKSVPFLLEDYNNLVYDQKYPWWMNHISDPHYELNSFISNLQYIQAKTFFQYVHHFMNTRRNLEDRVF